MKPASPLTPESEPVFAASLPWSSVPRRRVARVPRSPRSRGPRATARSLGSSYRFSVATSSVHVALVPASEPGAVDHLEPLGGDPELAELLGDRRSAVRGGAGLVGARRELPGEHLPGEVVARREERGEDVDERRRLQRRDRRGLVRCLALGRRADGDAAQDEEPGELVRRVDRAGCRPAPAPSGPPNPSFTVSAPIGPTSRSAR